LSQIERIKGTNGLAFKTCRGFRYPKTGYYGSSGPPNSQNVERIFAPGVFGLGGNWAWVYNEQKAKRDIVSGLILRSRELVEGTQERSFLLAMEPYLFPVRAPYTEYRLLLAGKFATKDHPIPGTNL